MVMVGAGMGRRGAGSVFGFGARVRRLVVPALGMTPDQFAQAVSGAAYAGYTGGYVWAYAAEFPQLDFDALSDQYPHNTRFVDLVNAGVLTRDDVIAGFDVDPTFAAQNPAQIDSGIMASQAFATVANDNAAFQQTVQQLQATAPAPAAPSPAAVVQLVNGQNVDGAGTPYPYGDPHYYNALADMIDQVEAQGGQRGAVTVSEAALAKSNPVLVDDLPPDLLSAYGTAFDAALHPPAPPADGTGGVSNVTSGPATGGTSTVGGGDMPQPTSGGFAPGAGSSYGAPSDVGGASSGPAATMPLAAGLPGGAVAWLGIAALAAAVVASSSRGSRGGRGRRSRRGR